MGRGTPDAHAEVVVKKLDYDTIVWSRRGQAGKRRGPQPKPKAKRAPKGRAATKAPAP